MKHKYKNLTFEITTEGTFPLYVATYRGFSAEGTTIDSAVKSCWSMVNDLEDSEEN